jgi:hypothetical protein
VRLLIFKKIYLLKGVIKNCTTIALTVILIFLKYKISSIKFLPLLATTRFYNSLNVEKKYYKELFKYISRCITLNYYDESVAFLLYSKFFEFKVPCNLIKIYLFGVKKVIEFVKNNLKLFARLIIR